MLHLDAGCWIEGKPRRPGSLWSTAASPGPPAAVSKAQPPAPADSELESCSEEFEEEGDGNPRDST